MKQIINLQYLKKKTLHKLNCQPSHLHNSAHFYAIANKLIMTNNEVMVVTVCN